MKHLPAGMEVLVVPEKHLQSLSDLQEQVRNCAADGLPHPVGKELSVEAGLLPPAGQGLPLRYHHVEQKERQERQELVTKSVTS